MSYSSRKSLKHSDELLNKKKPKALPTFEDPKDMANKTATFFQEKIDKIMKIIGPQPSVTR